MSDRDSAIVYVVSLGKKKIGDSELTSIDILKQKNMYFHPNGIHGWPKEPPNYIGFRYNGKLQSIRHVDNAIPAKNLHKIIPEIHDAGWEGVLHLVYTLGEEIKMKHIIKTGRLFGSCRVKCSLSTLINANEYTTVADAVHETHRLMQLQNALSMANHNQR